jgi:glycosyltransferase involved in cell wall biosynthesis
VVTLDAPGQPFLEGNPFETVALGPGVLTYSYSPKLVPWLREHAQEFDAVIVNGIWQYSSFAVWRALRGTSVPYFVFTHGMLDPYFKRTFPLKHIKKWLYWPWAEYRTLRDARAVLFTCEEERRLARQSFWLYRCREEVVGYGTAPPPVERAQALAEFHAAHPFLQGKRVLLFLSRIHGKKGCDLLIDAFADLASRDDRWQLVLAGPCASALGATLRARVRASGLEPRVTWTGMLAGHVKWGALYAAEAFVLPSHQENFGIAVAEALACGTPVLISNQVNIWREIDEDGAGFVEPDTLAGTKALLRRWSDLDDEQRRAMRQRAKQCFESRFDIRVAARALSDRIDTLCRVATRGRTGAHARRQSLSSQ